MTGQSDSPPLTEGSSPRHRDLDVWEPLAALDSLWEGQMAAIAALKPALPALAAAVEAARERLARGGRLVYAGAGTSGRLAVQDGAELHPTFAWPSDRVALLLAGGSAAFVKAVENAEDDQAAGEAAVVAEGVGEADVIVAVAASGSTPFTLAALREGRRRGALGVAVANSPGSPLLEEADHAILLDTGPEAVAGSTRMKAGTAQRAALTMFSTLVMVRLGRTHQGLMVDLVATNEKLRRRAERILKALTGCADEQAQKALAAASGRVKPAVLMLNGAASLAEAEDLLDRRQGRLRSALADLRAGAMGKLGKDENDA